MPGTRPKLLHTAMAMMMATGIDSVQQHAMDAMDAQLQYRLQNAHKSIRSGKPSRAAHYKRLAKKRRIQRARSAKK